MPGASVHVPVPISQLLPASQLGETPEIADVSFVVPLTAAAGDILPVQIEGGYEGGHEEDVLLRLKLPEGATPGALVHVPVPISQLLRASQLGETHEPTSPTGENKQFRNGELGETREIADVSFVVPLTAAAGDIVPVEVEGGYEGCNKEDVVLRLKLPEGATPGASVHVPVPTSQLLRASTMKALMLIQEDKQFHESKIEDKQFRKGQLGQTVGTGLWRRRR